MNEAFSTATSILSFCCIFPQGHYLILSEMCSPAFMVSMPPIFAQPTLIMLNGSGRKGLVSKGNSMSKFLPLSQLWEHTIRTWASKVLSTTGNYRTCGIQAGLLSPRKALLVISFHPHPLWFITVSFDLLSLVIKSIKLPLYSTGQQINAKIYWRFPLGNGLTDLSGTKYHEGMRVLISFSCVRRNNKGTKS